MTMVAALGAMWVRGRGWSLSWLVVLVVPVTPSFAAPLYLLVGGSRSRGLGWLATAPCARVADTAHDDRFFCRNVQSSNDDE